MPATFFHVQIKFVFRLIFARQFPPAKSVHDPPREAAAGCRNTTAQVERARHGATGRRHQQSSADFDREEVAFGGRMHIKKYFVLLLKGSEEAPQKGVARRFHFVFIAEDIGKSEYRGVAPASLLHGHLADRLVASIGGFIARGRGAFCSVPADRRGIDATGAEHCKACAFACRQAGRAQVPVMYGIVSFRTVTRVQGEVDNAVGGLDRTRGVLMVAQCYPVYIRLTAGMGHASGDEASAANDNDAHNYPICEAPRLKCEKS